MSLPHASLFPAVSIPEVILQFVNVGYLRDITELGSFSPRFALTEEGDAVLCIRSESQAAALGLTRYVVALFDEGGLHLDNPIETDSLPELLRYLADHWDILLS